MIRSRSNAVLAALILLALATQTGGVVFLQQTARDLAPFSFALNWLMSILMIPCFFVVWVIMRLAVKLGFLSVPTSLDGMTGWRLIPFGGMAGVINVISSYFASRVPAISQAIFGPTNTALPFLLFFSFLILRHRYSMAHIGSVLLVMLGMAMSVIPDVVQHQTNSRSHSDREQKQQQAPIAYSFVWLTLGIVNALMCVYEEFLVRKFPRLNMITFCFLISMVQMPFVFMAAPLSLTSLGDGVHSFSDLMARSSAALHCLIGTSDPLYCQPMENCNCASALRNLMLLTVCNAAGNLISLCLLFFGSAVFMQIVSLTVTPMAFLIFSMINQQLPFFIQIVAVLILVVGGSFFYYVEAKFPRLSKIKDVQSLLN